jgi:prepilin peptidase CpaA
MLHISTDFAFWLLLAALPVCLWVVYTDLKDMKIRNVAVLALLGLYGVIGALLLPLEAYLWRYAHFAVVLGIGFLLHLTGRFGAGDAKFAAVLALFVALPDAGTVMILLSSAMIAALVLHRVARRIPPIRRLTPGWKSWDAPKFPLGTALGTTLALYLGLGVLYGT